LLGHYTKQTGKTALDALYHVALRIGRLHQSHHGNR
jgi:hypothetical protein